ILMLFEGRGFYFEREVLQDHNSNTWPLLATIGPPDCLRAAGITHVLLNIGAVDYYVRGGADPAVLRWDEFDAFARRCLTPVARTPAHVLFEVRRDRLEAYAPAR